MDFEKTDGTDANNPRRGKKVLVAVPGPLLEQIDYVARCEHRTRSDLMREAFRRYVLNFAQARNGAASIERRG